MVNLAINLIQVEIFDSFHFLIYVCACVCFSQKLLLAAMDPCNEKLNRAEKARNRHTECAVYSFDKELDYPYDSSLPGILPNIVHCHVK